MSASAATPGGPSYPSFLLIVKSLTGVTCEVTATESMTVLQLKTAVGKHHGDTPAEELRLIYAGKDLNDSKTIGDYAIPAGATLHMLFRLRD